MSRGIEAEELYAAVEKAAALVGARCARDEVWPILSAYQDAFTEGLIVFSIGGREAGELEYTVQVSAETDPYQPALAGGFVPRTDHPVTTLLPEIRSRAPVGDLFIDGGVVGGFKKIYTQFQAPQKVADLAALPSAPPALAANADYFARHGLTDIVLTGIDYQNRTMNLYFQLPAPLAGNLEDKAIRAMLREIGLPEPSDPMVTYARGSYRVYPTIGWDSPQIKRISFAPQPRRGMDLTALPVQLPAHMEQFLRGAPHTYTGELVNASAVKWTPTAEHLDLAAYYQATPRQLQFFDGNA
ncbi:aromatic prenyltransferase Orf2 [Streptomyces sp. TLI_55]|uniref:aromatic prenyltransferase n=1 Tax=Streptomyces sp. TLI_55 TaxID=1938861 RepID=UPI000BDB6568|nr:aromatic prenyltransferase [Streptomyces sp. TLI_55]SNX88210.1 aromatic prenyltransferase Orf2 [Streptomyces sp. TLI_55]